MDILAEFEPGAARVDEERPPTTGEAGVLSRVLLGRNECDRLDLRMDLLATSWLGLLIAAVADYRVGLVFLVIGFVLTALSARFGLGAEQPA